MTDRSTPGLEKFVMGVNSPPAENLSCLTFTSLSLVLPLCWMKDASPASLCSLEGIDDGEVKFSAGTSGNVGSSPWATMSAGCGDSGAPPAAPLMENVSPCPQRMFAKASGNLLPFCPVPILLLAHE